MDKIKALVLDLDGTLVDSLPDISWAMNTILENYGLKTFPQEEYRFMVGRGMRQLLINVTKSQNLSTEDFEKALNDFVNLYKNNPVRHSVLYEGIQEMLDSLGAFIPLVVLSNKDDEVTQLVVKKLMPRTQFFHVQGAVAHVPHKPDPMGLNSIIKNLGISGEQALYLGDTDVDMETALRGGCFPCGALWGFRTREELEKAGAQKVFNSSLEFRDWALGQLSKG